MNWLQFSKIKKFTTKKEIDNIIGKPKKQIDSLPVFYYDNGFLVGYSSIRYRISGTERSEYGNVGAYAESIIHFADIQALKTHFRLSDFVMDDIKKFEGNIVNDYITYDSKFIDVLNWMNKESQNVYKTSGETRRLIDGKVEKINIFIKYGQYKLFFYGKKINSVVSGFEYTLSE